MMATSEAVHISDAMDQVASFLDFVQTDAWLTTTDDHCHFAHDRVKNGPADFYSIQAGSYEFVDTTFSGTTMIRDAAHPQDRGHADLSDFVTAADIVDSIDIVYPPNHYSLFGTTGVSADDIYQGALGNCWFMHGAAAVANKPGRLEKVFLNNELSTNGIYGFQFYILGVPTTVTIDDSIPLVFYEGGKSAFAKVSDDGALWGPLIEKAFAKLHGNYESLIIGFATHSINVLTGAPSTRHYLDADDQPY